MGEIVNLRRVKRARLRAEAAVAAGEARVVHGRSRGERAGVAAELARVGRVLDGAVLGEIGLVLADDGLADDAHPALRRYSTDETRPRNLDLLRPLPAGGGEELLPGAGLGSVAP